jgi:hypothetical protein
MPELEEFYAFVYEENPEMEGLIAFQVRNAQGQMLMLPLCSPSEEQINSYLPLAKGIGSQIGKKVKLVKFTGRTDLQVIEPSKLDGLIDFNPPDGSKN